MNRFLISLFLALGLVQPIQAQYVKYYETINQLLAANPNDLSKMASVRSMTGGSVDDGATFFYDKTSVAATNVLTVFKPNGYNGRWLRVGSSGGGGGGSGDVTQTGDNVFVGDNTFGGLLSESNPIVIQHGTTSTPYRTLTNAFASLQSGDTMTIKGGTWNVKGHYYTTDVGDLSESQYLWIKSLTNVTIQGVGPGTILSITNYGNGITIDNCKNIVLRDMTIIGSTTGLTATNWIQAAINHRRTNDQTTINNVAFENIPDQAISHIADNYGRPSTSWIVTNCRFRNIGQTLFAYTGLPDGSCVSGAPANLVFVGNFGTNLNAIAVEFDTKGNSATGMNYGDGLVSGNVLLGTYDAAVGLPQWYTNQQSRITITGNTFAERTTGYRPTGHAIIPLYGNSDVTIVGNTFSASPQSYTAFITLGNGLGSYTNAFCTNIVISGNTFSGGGYGIYSDSGTFGLTIGNNAFRDQGQVSAQVWANGFSIVGNTFSGNSRASSGTYALTLFANDATALMDNGIVSDNSFHDLLTTPRMGGAVAVAANSPPTNIVILHNTIGSLTNGAAPYYYVNYAPANATFASSLVLSNNLVATGSVLAGDGNTGLPGFAFANDTDTGIYRSDSSLVVVHDGAYEQAIRPDGIAVSDDTYFGWQSDASWTNVDTSLRRVGPGMISIGFGSITNAELYSYDATAWNGSRRLATEDAVRDKIESLVLSGETNFADITATNLTVVNPINVPSGGIGIGTVTAGALLSGNGTNALDVVTVGSGLSLSGSPGGARTLTSTGGTGTTYSNLTETGYTVTARNLAVDTNATVAGTLTATTVEVSGTNYARLYLQDADATSPEHFMIASSTNNTNNTGWFLPGDTNLAGYLYASPVGSSGYMQLSYAIPSSSGVAVADIDTSAELRAIVGDESGTAALLFAGGNIGAATATTPAENDNDTSVATTAYVQTEIAGFGAGATNIDYGSANRYTVTNLIAVTDSSLAAATATSVTIGTTNVVGALAVKAPLASPALTGDPTVPNVVLTDSDTTAANTAFVKSNITALAISSYAPLASPTLTGDPLVPNQALADSDTSAANTAFVKSNITALAIANYAPLASPTLTGNPLVPNQALSDTDTSAANTAFVKSNITALSLVYQVTDPDLDDLADGSLTGSKVGTGISGTYITAGTVPDAQIASTLARDSEVTAAVAAYTNYPHLTVNAVAYNGTSWNGNTNVPAMDAVRDEMETKKSTRVGVIREIWVPSSAMNPPASGGPAASTNVWATTTDAQSIETFDFDADTDETVMFTLTLPIAWDGADPKMKLFWKPVTDVDSSEVVVWGIVGGSINDNEDGGNTLGTAAQVSDTGLQSTNKLHLTAAGAVDIGGTPSAGHMVWFKVYRDANDGSDTMEGDARLIGVQLQYTETTTEPSAW